jgi:hypothetical protein
MIVGCKHFVNERRVWCPPMCPVQCWPRPTTSWSRWRWAREHRKERPEPRGEAGALLGADRVVQQLIGCAWGRVVSTDDDPEPCPDQAVAIVVLQFTLKLCTRHKERMDRETTPHMEPL